MKNSKLVVSGIMASLLLAGCSHTHAPKEKYVVVEDGYYAPVAAARVAVPPMVQQPIVVQEPCCQAPTQTVHVDACCHAPEPKAEPIVEKVAPEVIKEVHYIDKPKPQKAELLKITGIGYGAESTYQAYTPGQRRLMAIRSSKLDAYRSLAEQIYGIKIDSNTSVATLTAKNDSFRARVNAVVRGARLISVTPMADNNYETVLEVYVDKSFFEETFVYSGGQQEMAVDPDDMYRFRTLH